MHSLILFNYLPLSLFHPSICTFTPIIPCPFATLALIPSFRQGPLSVWGAQHLISGHPPGRGPVLSTALCCPPFVKLLAPPNCRFTCPLLVLLAVCLLACTCSGCLLIRSPLGSFMQHAYPECWPTWPLGMQTDAICTLSIDTPILLPRKPFTLATSNACHDTRASADTGSKPKRCHHRGWQHEAGQQGQHGPLLNQAGTGMCDSCL